MLRLFCGLHTADESALGRFDHLTMNQQALMEAVVEQATFKKGFQDEKGNYLDLSEWNGVTINAVSQEVTEIHWSPREASGTLVLRWLPRSVRILTVAGPVIFYGMTQNVALTCDFTDISAPLEKVHISKVSVVVRFALLPEGLETLSLHDCRICGFLSLKDLPRTLRHLNMPQGGKFLTGILDLRDAPKGLVLLAVTTSGISALFGLDFAPQTLKEINIKNNPLGGPIDLTAIAPSITNLSFPTCGITGSIDLTSLPGDLWALDASCNKITGAVDLTRLPEKISNLLLNGNRITGTLDLTRLPESIRYIDLSGNKLHGTVDLQSLPDFFEELYLDENDLKFIIDFRRPCFALDDFTFAERTLKWDGVWESGYDDKLGAF